MTSDDIGEIRIALVRIEEKVTMVCDDVVEIKEELKPLLEPNGLCERSRSKLVKVSTKVDGNSKLIYTILIAVGGVAIFVLGRYIVGG